MSLNDLSPLAGKSSALMRNSTPVQAFLWGEFAINIGRGYLLIAFTQLLYRGSGGLWHNLFYVASDAFFAFAVPFIAGAWVDRHGCGVLLSRSALTQCALLLLCAAGAAAGWLSPGGVLGASLVTSALNASVRVCVFTLTPALAPVEGLMRINGRQQVAFQSGNLAGVLLAGVLLDRLGTAASFLMTGVCTALAACCYARAAVVDRAAGMGLPTHNPRAGFLQLAPALIRKPMLLALFALGAGDLVAVSIFNLTLPVLIARHFGGRSLALAGVDSAFTLGSVLLGWVVGRYALKGRQLHTLLLLMPLALGGFELQTVWFDQWVCVGLAFCTGVFVAAYSVYFSATVQALVPSSLRGRFAALRRMVSTTIVAGASYSFTLGYAHDGLRGANVVSLSIAVVVLATCTLWIIRRRVLRTQIAAVTVTALEHDEHADLAPLFEPFIHFASADRRRQVR
ncbi:MFS transporter [Paraburkholderia tropica]|uniref:MFS transporter n=1 Tax=Paraburkholderia tropica TaxID=92647 RepID=UPI0032B33F95